MGSRLAAHFKYILFVGEGMSLGTKDYKNTTKRLLILWLASLGVCTLCLKNSEIAFQLSTGIWSVSHLITTVLMVFYFLPLLYKLYRNAKLAQMKGIKIVVLAVLVHHCFWLFLNVICTICALIWPELLS